MMSWIKQLQAYQGGWGRLVVLLAGELLDCLTDMLQALCKWASNNLVCSALKSVLMFKKNLRMTVFFLSQ